MRSKILNIVISLFIYIAVYFILIRFTSSNDIVINFLRKINNSIFPMPSYLSTDDVLRVILPSIFFANSILCGLVIIAIDKLFFRKNEKFKLIKFYLFRISIFLFFLFFINYVKSFYDNETIVKSYKEAK